MAMVTLALSLNPSFTALALSIGDFVEQQTATITRAGRREAYAAGRVVADDARHLLSVREQRMDSNVARQGGQLRGIRVYRRDQPTELQ
jgi:hypothetical protein